jgi:uncharacterized membrane protein (UPF0127 family)
MRALTSLLVAALGVAECQQTPPENFGSNAPAVPPSRAAASSSSSSIEAFQPVRPEAYSGARTGPTQAAGNATLDSASAGANVSDRCIAPTPAQPPPAVPRGPDPRCPVDPEDGGARLPLAHVGFPDVSGVGVEAEIARSERESARGLMYRKSMPEEHGMLFDLRVRAAHPFWMHNTCIPLDMIYIDEDGLIVGIVENAPTLDDGTRDVGCPSRWVLEVNAGWSRRHGIRAGQHVALPR